METNDSTSNLARVQFPCNLCPPVQLVRPWLCVIQGVVVGLILDLDGAISLQPTVAHQIPVQQTSIQMRLQWLKDFHGIKVLVCFLRRNKLLIHVSEVGIWYARSQA